MARIVSSSFNWLVELSSAGSETRSASLALTVSSTINFTAAASRPTLICGLIVGHIVGLMFIEAGMDGLDALSVFEFMAEALRHDTNPAIAAATTTPALPIIATMTVGLENEE